MQEPMSDEVAGRLEDPAAIEEDAGNLLAEWKQSIHAAAARPEAFWQFQRRAIAARRRPWWAQPRLVWAMAFLVLTAAWLNHSAQPRRDVAQTDPDQMLMTDIERSVRREVPRALEPATLLTEEMDRAAQAQRNP